MSIDALPNASDDSADPRTDSAVGDLPLEIRKLLKPLASLKITVFTFALSLLLVFLGTLAQVDADIWEVVRKYFRCWFAWVPVSVLHPMFARIALIEPLRDWVRDLSPSVGFWFPGGFTIGAIMGVNLFAAHALRFRVQASGTRLSAGLVVTLIGGLATWIVISSGHGEGLQEASIGWDQLWNALKALTVTLAVMNLWGIYQTFGVKKAECLLLCLSLVIVSGAAWWLVAGSDERLTDSSMRILWQVTKAEIASLILLAGCFLLFKKRAGVVLLHGGVALMMLNEIVVDTQHVETQMGITEGETANWAHDIREFELVFSDSSNAEYADEVAIPQAMILKAADALATEDTSDDGAALISDPKLPFDVEIVRFMQNSAPRERVEIRLLAGRELGVPPIRATADASFKNNLGVTDSKLSAFLDTVEDEFSVKLTDTERAGIDTVGDLTDLLFKEKNLAKSGVGLTYVAPPTRASTGTDSSSGVDFTSAYIRLIDRESKAEVGTYLTGVYFDLINNPEMQPNIATKGETSWGVDLRFRRYYKPYSVTLKDVSKTDYLGTSTPRDYRSVVQVVDPVAGDNFEKHIWMNNPMRYAGETFYQSNYQPADPRTGSKEKTTLSVVTNTGWMIPYVSCMIVATGMMSHFWIALVRFLRRRESGQDLISMGFLFNSLGAPVGALLVTLGFTIDQGRSRIEAVKQERAIPDSQKNLFAKCFPWVVALLVAGSLMRAARVPETPSGEQDYAAFGRLPLVYEGRVKPFDTLARNSLRMLSNRTEFNVIVTNGDGEVVKDDDGNDKVLKKQPAIRWLLDLIADPAAVAKHRVFRIDHPQLLEKLKLEKRKSHLYALDEFADEIMTLMSASEQARRKDAGKRDADDRAVLELERKLGVFDLLSKTFTPSNIKAESWQDDLKRTMSELQALDNREPPLSVPPVKSSGKEDVNASDVWEPFARGWAKSWVAANLMQQPGSEPVTMFTEILVAHSTGKTSEFNRKVADYQRWLELNAPDDLDVKKVNFEAYYNGFAPFYQSSYMYLVAFLLSVIALLGWQRPLNKAAFLVIFVTLLLHTYALWARVHISGRPPVTNLYSSAVFIGWGCVVLGLVFEAIFKVGIGNIIGSALGAGTLLIAYLLEGDGDTFKVLQAVLDTTFWLATHVVCITLGYSTTLLAGMLGLYYLVAGVFTPRLDSSQRTQLTRMIYGTVCFGIFFSFVGTVLGGLWADDSWGRFWGWDPKENGALLIVIWNALLLHARWDRMVGDKGMAALAIGGNIVTSWSWFGVNELGVGLHSYGFTEGAWTALWAFWLTQCGAMLLVFLPERFWWSIKAEKRRALLASADSFDSSEI